MIDKSKLKILKILLLLGIVVALGVLIGERIVVSLRSGNSIFRLSRPASLSEDFAVRQIANNYLQAWQDSDPEKMYVYLSNLDKSRVSMAEYARLFEAFPLAPLHFRLNPPRLVNPERAIVKVRFTWPDMSEERFIERDEQLVLVKEESVWRIREEESLN